MRDHQHQVLSLVSNDARRRARGMPMPGSLCINWRRSQLKQVS